MSQLFLGTSHLCLGTDIFFDGAGAMIMGKQDQAEFLHRTPSSQFSRPLSTVSAASSAKKIEGISWWTTEGPETEPLRSQVD